jgi:hypothetical protein
MNFIQIRTTGQQIRIKKVKINVKTNATVIYFPIIEHPPQEGVITKMNE